MTVYQILHFSLYINFDQLIKGYLYGFRYLTIDTFLVYAVYLEPVSLFLYTWRFLHVLEKSGDSEKIKRGYRWFAIITIYLIPLCFYGVFLSLVIETAKYSELEIKLEYD